jgi:hypothetical protein
LREFTTTEKDLEKGISRIPLTLSRLFEEDLIDDKGEFIPVDPLTNRSKGGGAGEDHQSSYMEEIRGGTVKEEKLYVDEIQLLDEMIEHRKSAFSNSSGAARNNSYGDDKATDDDGSFGDQKENLAPLFKRTTQTDANFNDFQIVSMIGKGTFGKVYLIKYKQSNKFYAMKSIRKDVVVELNSISNIHVEKWILLQVNHPFIISMEYVFIKSYRIYFIMDYIR